MTSNLNLVVAHSLEARFPVQWLGLQQSGDSPRQYSNGKGIELVVAGEGGHCAAAAVDFLVNAQDSSIPAAWLNFGIAGHQNLELGSALLPDKIRCAESGEIAYPSPMFRSEHRGLLVTVDEPEFEYPEDAAYDMEGFAFFKAASKQGDLELVQCLKLVSDNRQQPAGQVDKKRVEEVIGGNKSTFLALVEEMQSVLAALPSHYPYPDLAKNIQQSLHFTATQRSQLKRLMQRYAALGLESELTGLVEVRHENARALITRLQNGLSGKI